MISQRSWLFSQYCRSVVRFDLFATMFGFDSGVCFRDGRKQKLPSLVREEAKTLSHAAAPITCVPRSRAVYPSQCQGII